MAPHNTSRSLDEEHLHHALFTSSTKSRSSELYILRDQLVNEEISNDDQNLLTRHLLDTYSFYVDRGSRRAAQFCLTAALSASANANNFALCLDFITAEASKPNLASGSVYVLLELCAVLVSELAAHSSLWEKDGVQAVKLQAQVFERFLSTDPTYSRRASAVFAVRKPLRSVFDRVDNIKNTVHDLIRGLTTKSSHSTAAHSPYLGVLAQVASRNALTGEGMSDLSSDIYAFYSREIIGSRSPIPSHIASGLNGFFQNFGTQKAIEQEIIPSIEKALLRAPEVILSDLMIPFADSMPKQIDLTTSLSQRLLKPLLSNVKSTSAVIRDGSLSAFGAFISRCSQGQESTQIVDEILKNLKDAKSAEHRVIYVSMLASVGPSPTLSPKVLSGVSQIASKETNEMALSKGATCLSSHLSYCLSNDVPSDSVVQKNALNGLNDKKPSVRRIWALAIGDLIWNVKDTKTPSNALIEFGCGASDHLMSSWREVLTNPVQSVQSGLIVAFYVAFAILQQRSHISASPKMAQVSKKYRVDTLFENSDVKQNALVNPRVYTKVIGAEDQMWFARALGASSTLLSATPPHTACQWAQAAIFLTSSQLVVPHVRRASVDIIAHCYLDNPQAVASCIIEGVWVWLKNTYTDDRDSAAVLAQSSRQPALPIFKAICPLRKNSRLGREVVSKQLVYMLVLCRLPLLSRISWIDECLKLGQDPAAIVSEYAVSCLKQIKSNTNDMLDEFSRDVQKAACDAVAELIFVAPNHVAMQVANLIQEDLREEIMNDIGPTEAAIYRTPEGTAFIDVLSKSGKQQALNKSAKDYDTLKWEEEVRAQLAQKEGQKKKLSQDDQAKLKKQLEQESNIRQHVSRTAVCLFRGIGIINSLATGPPSDVEAWIGPATQGLLRSLDNGAELIVGDALARTYLALSEKVTERLGMLRLPIGIATLRTKGATRTPREYLQENLGDLVTRILYRMRFSSEQRPFDTVSLLYVLPLVTSVISSGGIDRDSVDDADEQITLALEFLSFHTDRFTNARLPRMQMLSLLVESAQRFTQHYRTLKESLLNLAQVIAPDVSEAETSILLNGCVVPQSAVRNISLHAIDAYFDLPEQSFLVEIWIACHDDDEENAGIAKDIWDENSLRSDSGSPTTLVKYLTSDDNALRNAASRALSESVSQNEEAFTNVVEELEALYTEKAKPRVPQKDKFGMPMKTDLRDPWQARHGVALAFKELAPSFDSELLVQCIQFILDQGPVADKNDSVRDEMVDSARTLISLKGQSHVEELLTRFETTLDAPDSGSQEQDKTNEAVIILYGALAQHLKAGDKRIPNIIDRLLKTLSTPSETVQYTIAGCLSPLAQLVASETHGYVQQLTDDLLHSKKYAGRRGAAYGLAGLVKGRGVSSLREYRILSLLKSASEEKKDSNQRQGAFLAYELLSLMLGPIFEPYVVQIVPQLLVGFGDSSTDVRDACLDASKTCFATLSSFGVKTVLPILLEGLDEQQWRSKKGACDSLGAMAYLDPQQLAISLPQIIPPLTQVLGDSHKEVRGAANRSLQRFGDVISNPEVKGLVNILLKALSDPTKYTDEALDALLKVSFVHYLDAPSLALVARILERGLGDRSATKRKSSQIIGSLAHLTDRRDLVSHLPILVSGLRTAAVDPVPTTRATASKALGSLVEKLGEDALPDLIPSLMSALKTDTGAGDRLGSAQALSEVLAGLGVGRLEETLPSILQNVSSAKATVREGFMSLFIFLPACFGNSFANHLGRIIPPILSGLADEIDTIREISLRAGRLLVKNFASKSIDLLLPELQRGLGDVSYRIRLSSIELVGDLLFNLTGISAKDEEDEEDAIDGAQAAGQSLVEVLGEERRNNVLSALYISRCDTSGMVRAAAINVWKALVATPRTLREITPTLTQVIIRRLGSSNMEQKHIASNALGELTRKAGEGVLSSLLPTLEESLDTSIDTDAKQGICIAMRELILSASPDSLTDHEPKLIAVVKTALVDHDPKVREAAAEAFDSLQQVLGKKVVDQILPNLLALLRDPDEAENALAGLLTLLTEATRSSIILPNLLPNLLSNPISSFNARALASLASVAGTAMTRRLSHILNSLLGNIINCKDEERLEALNVAFDSVILSMDEFDGLNSLMSAMLALMKHDDHRKRRSADAHLANFFSQTDVDYSRYYADLIRALLISFDDRDLDVVKAAWTALNTLTSRLRKEDMESLAVSTRQVLGQVGVPGHDLPGFSLPKGINAILPIFLQALINGSPDQRMQSALAISEIVDKANPDSLKPFVTQITGPLIRVVSERSVDVKAAILLTLNHLLEKIPTFLKPFLPQLQRTFTKALADTTSETLRNRAARALGTLITLTPRIDPLIGELIAGSKTPDSGVKNAMQKALFEVVSRVGANMNESSRNAIVNLIDDSSSATGTDDAAVITNARLLGALLKNISPETAYTIIKFRVLTSHQSKQSILSLNALLLNSSETLTKPFLAETLLTVTRGMSSSDATVSENSILAAGKLILSPSGPPPFDAAKSLFEGLAPIIQPGSGTDARRLALVVLRTISRMHNDLVRPHLPVLVPPVFASVRDLIIPIKLAAEAAFIALFDAVDSEGAVFEKYISAPGAGAELSVGQRRNMQDYFRRVALRLATQARERREAEGVQDADKEGEEGLTSEERDDLRELWSVGKVDLGEGNFEA